MLPSTPNSSIPKIIVEIGVLVAEPKTVIIPKAAKKLGGIEKIFPKLPPKEAPISNSGVTSPP